MQNARKILAALYKLDLGSKSFCQNRRMADCQYYLVKAKAVTTAAMKNRSRSQIVV